MLVTMKEILDRAAQGNYGVAAPNVSSEFDARACLEVAEDLNSPLILDVFYGATSDIHLFGHLLRELAEQSSVPVCINLDHGGKKAEIIKAMQSGFTSVMIDRSSCDYETNVKVVKEIVEIAHSVGITVEAELGHVGRAANAEVDTKSALTVPEEAKRFVEETGVDCLAVAIGTAHGAYPKGFVPHLDFARLAAIIEAVGQDYPLVLHGSSGMDNESLAKACTMGINKINIATELTQAAAESALVFAEGKAKGRFWRLLKEAMQYKLAEKIKVYGSEGKAWEVKKEGLPHKKITMEEK